MSKTKKIRFELLQNEKFEKNSYNLNGLSIKAKRKDFNSSK